MFYLCIKNLYSHNFMLYYEEQIQILFEGIKIEDLILYPQTLHSKSTKI